MYYDEIIGVSGGNMGNQGLRIKFLGTYFERIRRER